VRAGGTRASPVRCRDQHRRGSGGAVRHEARRLLDGERKPILRSAVSEHGTPGTVFASGHERRRSNVTALRCRTTVKWIAEDNVGNISSVFEPAREGSDPTAPTGTDGLSTSRVRQQLLPGQRHRRFFLPGWPTGKLPTPAATGATERRSTVASYKHTRHSGARALVRHAGGAYTYDANGGHAGRLVTRHNGRGSDGSGTSFTAKADGNRPERARFTCERQRPAPGGWNETSSPVRSAIDGPNARATRATGGAYVHGPTGTDPDLRAHGRQPPPVNAATPRSLLRRVLAASPVVSAAGPP